MSRAKWISLFFMAWVLISGPVYADQVYTGEVFRERIAFATNEFFIESVTPAFTVNILMNGVLQESHDGDSYMFTLEGTGAAARLVSYATFVPNDPGLLEFSFSGTDPDTGELLEFTDSYTVLPAPTTDERDTIGGWIASVSDHVQGASDYFLSKTTGIVSEIDANEAILDALQISVDSTLPSQITLLQTAAGGWIANVSAEVNQNETKIDTVDGVVDSIAVNTGTDIPARIAQVQQVAGGWIANVSSEVNQNESKIDIVDTVVDGISVNTGTTIPGAITTSQNNIIAEIGIVNGNVNTARTITGGWIKSVSDIVVPYGPTLSDILTDTGTTIPAQIISMVSANQIVGATMLFSNLDISTGDIWVPADPIIRNCSASLGGSQDYSSILINQFDDGSYELSVYDYRLEGTDTVKRRYVFTAATWNDVLAIIRRSTPDGLESHYGL